ncbi:hypothetical protein EVAR_9925_1 [Eumeta japonica]|uniref:Uncharacterized protein n=1 Tax=Eumeta variegata TaxID=151549 RepID=A0A4C1TQR8_EUMVA|nr:hypothetical protein EVAR_9925_1 [Eumeta japonica]
MTSISISSATCFRRNIGHSSRTCSTSWIFAGSQAQHGEFFSLNLCRYCANPPSPVRVCAILDVIPVFWRTRYACSTREKKHLVISPVLPSAYRSCHSSRLAALITFFAYDSGYLSYSAAVFLVRAARLASSSARSLPAIPACALTQNKRTALPSATISEVSRYVGQRVICPRRRVPRLLSVPPLHQGRTDSAFNTATVGINARPDDDETVHRLGVEVLDALVPDLGHVRRVGKPPSPQARSTKCP